MPPHPALREYEVNRDRTAVACRRGLKALAHWQCANAQRIVDADIDHEAAMLRKEQHAADNYADMVNRHRELNNKGGIFSRRNAHEEDELRILSAKLQSGPYEPRLDPYATRTPSQRITSLIKRTEWLLAQATTTVSPMMVNSRIVDDLFRMHADPATWAAGKCERALGEP